MKHSMHNHLVSVVAGAVAVFCSFLVDITLVAAENISVLFTDSAAAVLQANLAIDQMSIVSANDNLRQPYGIAAGPNGELYVSDTGASAIFVIDPNTGAQAPFCAGGDLGWPMGLAVESDGSVVVANGVAVVRVNPTTGVPSVLSSQGNFMAPVGIAVQSKGAIMVVDAGRKVIQVDSKSGRQKLISQGGFLKNPQGIAVNGNTIYVTDVGTSTGNYGVGRVLAIDARTGRQTILSEGDNLVGPVGIDIGPNGQIYVGDPYTVNPDSVNVFDGGIIEIDPATGSQTLLARGFDNYVNPRGVVAVPAPGTVMAKR